MFNEEVAHIKAEVEKMMSIRWGVPVKFKEGETLMWRPNKRY
jgi:hypothetical protein